MTKLQQLGGQPALGSADTIAKKIDFHSGEDALSWSLRTAKRIVNYRRPEIVDLVLTEKTINWNKNAATPFVAYQVTYENRGKHSINVNVEVQCISAPRNDRDDFFHWEKIDANNFAFTLAPTEKKTLSGTMQWFASQYLMPWIVASPDPTGLIEVRDPTALANAPSQTLNNGLNATTTAGSRADVGYWLSHVIGSSRSNFVSLRAGPGELDDGDVIYPIDPQFPGSQRSVVWLPDPGSESDPHVYVTLSETSDEAAARQKYIATTSNVKSELQKIGHWDERNNPGTPGTSTSHSFSQGNLDVTISMRLFNGVYKVTVEVASRKG